MTDLSQKKIVTVSELTSDLRAELEQTFGDLWVEGEITNLKIPSSGHLYFSLKDQTAQIKAVFFRSYGRRITFIPKEGEAVLIRGHLSLYEPRGELQIIVDHIEPRGVGALMAAFEALKERLRLEGLFDDARKKPIPIFPRTIALITSPTGAVVQDFLRIIKERKFPVDIVVCPVLVQGERAAKEIARMIERVNKKRFPVDLIVIARGGGSLEDLWAFNEEIVARAISQSEIPVITAIGHETDTTIADFVADLRAPTPSVAAELIAREGEKQIERFYFVQDRLKEAPIAKIKKDQYRLTMASRLLAAKHPKEQVIRLKQAGISLDRRLHLAGKELIASRQRVVSRVIGQIDLLSPLKILGRGYSITTKQSRDLIVRDCAEVAEEEQVMIRLHQGELLCVVKERRVRV